MKFKLPKFNSLKFILIKEYRKLQAYLGTINSEKLKGYTYIVLTLFTVSFFGLAAISPTLNTVINLDKQFDDNSLVYNALKQKLSNLVSLDEQYTNLQDDINSVYSAIPKSPKIPLLTRQIENLAKMNNLIVSKLTFGTVEIYPNDKGIPIYSFTFTVEVVGNRSDANNFIADIINFDRIVGIDRVVTGVNQEKQYNLSFTGRAYFIPD